jgi:hypothetical protein
VTLADVNAAHQDVNRVETQEQRENVVSFRRLLTPGEKFQFVRQLKADLEHLPPICLAIGDTITDKQINFLDHPLRGYCALGNEAIAADCHCTERTVSRCLAQLKARGHIGIKRRYDGTNLIWPILKSDRTKMSDGSESDSTKMSAPIGQNVLNGEDKNVRLIPVIGIPLINPLRNLYRPKALMIGGVPILERPTRRRQSKPIDRHAKTLRRKYS